MNDIWLIWSCEFRAWWKPDACGYTKSVNASGRYSLEVAVGICFNANQYNDDEQVPNETMVPLGSLQRHP
jgi:hypothetical protein